MALKINVRPIDACSDSTSDELNVQIPIFFLYRQLLEIVIQNDYTTSLTYLMKYPTNIDVMLIIRHALHMISPEVRHYWLHPQSDMINAIVLNVQKYVAPPGINASSHRQKSTGIPNRKLKNLSTQKLSVSPNDAHISNGTAFGTRTIDSKRSLPESNISSHANDTTIHERINSIQSTTARSTVRIAAQQQQPGHPDPSIVDGYVENVRELTIANEWLNRPSSILIVFIFFRAPKCLRCSYKTHKP